MRKRTINYCFDKILWGIIMLLPIILYLVFIIFYLNGQRDLTSLPAVNDLSFYRVMSYVFGWFYEFIPEDNIFYSVFHNIFLDNFDFLFDSSRTFSFILWYAVYLIMIEFLHILVDVLLLLPRICRKFLDKFKSEDC